MICGWLFKLGDKHKTWRRRWFLLSEGVLYYFKVVPEFTPIASIDLHVSRLQEGGQPHELQLVTPDRIFSLRAESEELAAQWLAAFRQGVQIEGWLEKRGRFNTSYRRRWFVADMMQMTLCYFKEPPEFAPLGNIAMSSLAARPQRMDGALKSRSHCFQLQTAGRVYYLSAQGEQEVSQWVTWLGEGGAQDDADSRPTASQLAPPPVCELTPANSKPELERSSDEEEGETLGVAAAADSRVVQPASGSIT